jgi:hypothetical protein
MQLKYIGDNMELYGRTFNVLEVFEYSYNIDADGVITRVSMHDVELKEEDYGRKRAMDH